VYPWDEGESRVSVLSPLGCALLGSMAESTLAVGARRFTLGPLRYQPEAAGDHHL
jgi:hypothetical protein